MQKTKAIFKTCPMCKHTWRTKDDFLNGPHLRLVGFQSNFKEIEEGMILFLHYSDNCGTTLAIPVKEFSDLYKGGKYAESKYGTDKCEAHCLDEGDIERCTVKCKNAYIREVLQILRNK